MFIKLTGAYFENKNFSFFFCLFIFGIAFAEYNIFAIPDSAEIRRTIVDSWISAPVSEVRNYKEDLRKNRIGETFQIRMEENKTEFSVIVAPRSELDVDLINGDSHRIVRAAVYPKGAAGAGFFLGKKIAESLCVLNGILILIRMFFLYSVRRLRKLWLT